MLVEGNYATADILPILDGGPEALRTLNETLFDLFKSNNYWDGTRKQQAENDAINNLWHYVITGETWQ